MKRHPLDTGYHIPYPEQRDVRRLLPAAVLIVGFLSLLMFAWFRNAQINDYKNPPMIELINEVRSNAGVPEVMYYAPLSKTAKEKACDMKNNQYFEHLDKDGNMSWHYLTEAGINWNFAGENLHEGSVDTRTKMEAWMASPTHRAVLMNPQFDAVGYATCGDYTVQHFADLK